MDPQSNLVGLDVQFRLGGGRGRCWSEDRPQQVTASIVGGPAANGSSYLIVATRKLIGARRAVETGGAPACATERPSRRRSRRVCHCTLRASRSVGPGSSSQGFVGD